MTSRFFLLCTHRGAVIWRKQGLDHIQQLALMQSRAYCGNG
jgi:hypothetical protein